MMRTTMWLAFAFSTMACYGCSQEREVDVNVVVALKTDDASITVNEIHFASAYSLMGLSATLPPLEAESDGTYLHSHVVNSPEGNFVVVQLLRNGEPFRSEIYRLDPQILSRTGNQSEWVRPSGISSGEDDLHWRLKENPDSFQPVGNDVIFHTKLRYEVAKPYPY